ncbi:ribonucleotide reductase subunit alpha [Paucibacter sp. AS339]|uniref:ribonucleotide reductase subunit alpha n=1 Tax=Paucibacter hankyongi TaxID=3133434 RepID=UPI0030A6B5D1
MQITHFQDLLSAAAQQIDAQRLLMVFAGATLPENASPQQRADFEAGHGGELTPMMCVDKLPQDLANFEALAAEADRLTTNWQIVFATSLSGSPGQAPSTTEAEAALHQMVESIKAGRLDAFIPFNRAGEPVRLHAA